MKLKFAALKTIDPQRISHPQEREEAKATLDQLPDISKLYAMIQALDNKIMSGQKVPQDDQ